MPGITVRADPRDGAAPTNVPARWYRRGRATKNASCPKHLAEPRSAALAGGLVVVFGEIGASRVLKRTRSWPETTGEVLSFNLSRSYLGDFFAGIRYRYRVDGEEYVGETIRPGGRMTFRSKRLARDLESRYRSGVSVAVYYNPDNPVECCLDREQTAAGSSAMVWGLAVVVLGGFVLAQALRG